MQIIPSTKWEKWRAETLATKEPETIKWLGDFEPGSVFWDIGANIGIYTLYAAEFYKSSGICIYAFEPHIFNFQHLKENIELNKCSDFVKPVFVGLSDHDGIAQFDMKNLSAGSSGGQLLYDNVERKGIYTVPIRTVDSYAYEDEKRFPNYIKIDVDGQEDKIVAGMTDTLHDLRLKAVLIEINGPCDPIRQKFLEAGFTDENKYTAMSRKVMEQYAAQGYRKAYNAIFTRRGNVWFVRFFNQAKRYFSGA